MSSRAKGSAGVGGVAAASAGAAELPASAAQPAAGSQLGAQRGGSCAEPQSQPQPSSQPSAPRTSQSDVDSVPASLGGARAAAQRGPRSLQGQGLKAKRAGSVAARAGGGQRSMRAFLAAPAPAPACSAAPVGAAPAADAAAAGLATAETREGGTELANGAAAEPLGSSQVGGKAAGGSGELGAGCNADPAMSAQNPGLSPKGSGAVGRTEAAAAWRSIQQKMKPPKCAGHGEACVIRQVKKAGPNKGAAVVIFPSTVVLHVCMWRHRFSHASLCMRYQQCTCTLSCALWPLKQGIALDACSNRGKRKCMFCTACEALNQARGRDVSALCLDSSGFL